MQINFETRAAGEVSVDALAVIAFETKEGEKGYPAVEGEAGFLGEVRGSGEFTGKLYELVTERHPQGLAAGRLVIVGGGKQHKFSPVEVRRVAGALVRSLKCKAVRTIALDLTGYPEEYVSAAVEGAIVGHWEPDKYKADPKKAEKQMDSFTVVVTGGDSAKLAQAVERGRIVGEAQNLTRDLVNEPGNKLVPGDLAQAAQKVASESGLECQVMDRDAMAQLGMGALLGVAQGSDNPPFFIILKYRPSRSFGDVHLALVGKGVTFDTGGISIKPADSMEKMRYDMAGAGAAIGAMKAIAQLRPAVPVTAYIPTVENMLNGNAQRPGDIVTTLSGKTVEVLNTDAEGRLILADALTYAIRDGATHIIDAATLTGAIGVALGQYNIGAFTNDDPLLGRFMSASRAAGEKTWQMPCEEEYKEYLKSAFADLPNIGGRAAGSVTAAWFLREFADPIPWVHLDIAATAWLDEPKAWIAKGPTGVAVRSFVELAMGWQSQTE